MSFIRAKVTTKFRLLAYSPVLALLATVPTKLNVLSISKTTLAINPGPSYVLLLLVFVVYFGYGVNLLLNEYHKAVEMRRRQLYYILLGTLLTLVPATILSAILPLLGYPDAASFSPVTSIIFAALTAIAILRHRLFDIRFVVVRAAAYGLTVVLISAFYIVPAIWLMALLVHVTLSAYNVSVLAILSLALAVGYRYLHKAFDRVTKRIFYRHAYDPQDVLDRLSNLLAHTIDIARLQEGSERILKESLTTTSVKFWLDDSKDKALAASLFSSAPDSNVILVNEIVNHHTLVAAFRDKDIAAIVRLRTTHGDLGYIALEIKKSGEDYGTRDKRLLSTVADEIAISMQNALHFEEIQNFNETLQGRIATATKKLSETNQRLKKLDETKDEFISMASHQLRTPLTSVKGYLSMVLEGDAGSLNKNQRKLLEQSFVSSQRMVYLISDLLNLSRLNTGRFVIESTPIDLSSVIQDEVNQLAETAKSRELELIYNRPENFPMLMLDENKIHQVVMNFLDNAIYYTPSGGTVTIDLHETPTAVIYTVKDTGIGVPRSVQHKLFTKFYRAQNAQQARPDGTGLGLFMAKKVIAAQGGSLIFESVEGKGSTFGFRFSKSRVRVPTEKETTTTDKTGTIVK
jgi:signal transduction histidine kinase